MKIEYWWVCIIFYLMVFLGVMDLGLIGSAPCSYIHSGWTMDMDLSLSEVFFTGDREEACAGFDVSSAGDVNGDGYDDFLVLSLNRNFTKTIEGPKVHLIFGSDTVWDQKGSLSKARTSFFGYYIDNRDFSRIGDRAEGIGDINGDGFDDIAIECQYSDGGEEPETIYQLLLFFGRMGGWDDEFLTYEANASILLGIQNLEDEHRTIVSGAGDVNGDGLDDLLIGAPRHFGYESRGEVYLFLGKSGEWGFDIPIKSSDATFSGMGDFDQVGSSACIAGDLNGDGLDDIAITGQYNDTGGSESGKLFVFFGREGEWTGIMPVSSADVMYWGEHAGDNLGSSLSGAGDLNGDGLDDLLVGARHNGPSGWCSGKVYAVFGRPSDWPGENNISTADASFIGEHEGCGVGSSISGSGDIDGDGLDDIIVGASGDDEGGSNAGQVYVIKGRKDGWMQNISLCSSDASFVGEEAWDYAGSAVSGAGDVDGDGFDEILIGAYGNDYVIKEAGKVYLLFHTRSNRDPEITTRNVLKVSEDIFYTVHYQALDDDLIDDGLVWSMETEGQWMTIDPASGWLNGTPENGDVGFSRVTVKVEDTMGGSDSVEFLLEVVNVNDPPEILPPDVPPIMEGEHFEFTMRAFDVDSGPEDMVWTMEPFSTFMMMDPASGNLSGRPDNEDVGVHTITVKVEDGSGGIGALTFDLTVQNRNDPPFILTIPVTSAIEDEQYSQYFECRDIDDDVRDMTYHLDTNARFLSLIGRASVISGTPTNQDVGTWRVNFSARDDEDGYCWSNYTLTVMNVNDPPYWTDVPGELQVELGKKLEHRFGALDMDRSDLVTYFLGKGHGTEASIDMYTGEFIWAPSAEGRYDFSVFATDGEVQIKHSFEVLVWKYNLRPVMSPIDDGTAVIGRPFNLQVMAMDPDNDTLFFSLIGPPEGMEISPSGMIGWTPDEGQLGTYRITVSAKDLINDPAVATFNLTVVKGEEGTEEDGPILPLILISLAILALATATLVLFAMKRGSKGKAPAPSILERASSLGSERIERPADEEQVP